MADGQLHCTNCGHVASAGAEDWTTATHPTLGSVTQCANCGSTDVTQHR